MALTERLALLVDARVDGAVRDIKTLAKESGKTDDAAKKLEKRGAAIGTAWKIGAGVVATAALVKLGQMSKEAINDAAALGEQQSKTNVVFGTAAKEVREFGETAAKSLNLSEREALSAASTFGQFFDAAGMATEAGADMSMVMVELAADMASFQDADPSEVLQNLRSGLSGESEPLRKFGVFLNETAVAAKAAELGLEGVNGKLTDGEKIQARYAIIMEQTVKQQGDLARTSDSLSNKQRQQTALMENASAALGEGLLPAQLALTNALVDAAPAISAVGKGVGSLVSGFTKLPGPIQALVGSTALLGGGFLVLAPRIKTAKELLGSFSTEGGKAKSTMVGLGKAAGAAALAIGALEILNRLQPDDAAVGRFVEKLEALAGSDIDDQIASITAEIEKQQKIVGDAFGPQAEVFGVEIAPLEFGDDFKVAAANVDALKERLAQLKHQKELDAIASKDAAAGVKALGGATDGAIPPTQEMIDRQEKLAERLKDSRVAARGTAREFIGLGDSFSDNEVSLQGWMREMEKSTQALEDFRENAIRAARRGLNDGLIKSLQEAGPEGAMRMRQLANATDAEMKRVNAAWREGQAEMKRWVAFKVPSKKVDVDVNTAPAFEGLRAFINAASGQRIVIGIGTKAPTARADGGPVTRGETYLVGEEGPELFTASSSGRITPNDALGRSSGTSAGGMAINPRLDVFAKSVDKAAKITEKHAARLLESADQIRDGIADKVRSLKQERSGIASGVVSSFGQSVFGSEAMDIGGVLGLAGQQASDAVATKQAIAALIKKGISEGALEDLLAGGQSGMQQIKLLAGADAAQLAEFNKLTQIADSNLLAGGNLAGGSLKNDDIKAAERDERAAEKIVRMLKDALAVQDKNKVLELHIGAKVIRAMLDELERKDR